jgi:ATP-dependent DNA ligase
MLTLFGPPVGPQWIHEIKHDGHCLIARMHESRMRLFTRRGFRLDRALSAHQRGGVGASSGIRDELMAGRSAAMSPA